VPDYKDKEKLTPANCFPVNADGVGTCPEPACCTELRKRVDSLQEEFDNGGGHGHACRLTSLPSVTFKAGSFKLSKEAQAILTSAAAQLKANATCNVRVVGYVTDATKKAQQLSWDRVNAVIKFLIEKQGISEDRLIFSYDTRGPSNSVDLQPTPDKGGPNTVPAPPAPNFRSNK
jgi:outer membrane protein OmpA-like peptidoglycan-associated protein